MFLNSYKYIFTIKIQKNQIKTKNLNRRKNQTKKGVAEKATPKG